MKQIGEQGPYLSSYSSLPPDAALCTDQSGSLFQILDAAGTEEGGLLHR